MTSDELKVWRAREKLSQGELAERLGLTRGAIANYEAGKTAIPKTTELALAALAIGLREYDGGEVTLDRFKLVARYGVEWIEALDWRSSPQPEGTIREWFEQQEIRLFDDTHTTTRTDVAMMITLRWR